MSGPWHVVWQTEKQNKVVAALHAWICTDTFHLAPEWQSDICHPKVFGQKSPYPTVEHKPQLSPIKFAISHSTCKMFILYSMSTWIPKASISKSAYNYIFLCWLCCVLFKCSFIQELRIPQFYHPVLIIKKPSCWWTLGCIGLLRLYKEMRETHLTLDLLAIRPLLFMRDRLFDLLPSQLNLGEKKGFVLAMDMNGILKASLWFY